MGWAALSELVPYYPLYALLFLDTGLSAAQVSGLFAIWSLTALVAEVPAGVLADRWSRRGCLVAGGVLQAAAFAVWTAAPAYPAFAIGFLVWGLAGAMVSGTSEALVHDMLAEVGAESSFGRVNGAMTAAELVIQVPTAFAASALFAAGGYALVGWASVAVCLAAGLLALRFPEAPRLVDDDDAGLLEGVRTALRLPGLRLAIVAVALVGGLDAVEEYFPVLAGQRGVPTTAVPLAVLAVVLAGALGAAVGGRAGKLSAPAVAGVLGVAGLVLGAAAVLDGPATLIAAAVFYALYLAVLVIAEARLQQRITGPYRATLTSVAGVGIELASLLVFAAWAISGAAAVAVLVFCVVPLVATGLRAPTTATRVP